MITESEETIGFIMPAYNEEDIVETEVRNFVGFARDLPVDFELLLVENGSTDNTLSILRRLESEIDVLTTVVVETPNFGRALLSGIQSSAHEKNFIVHVDHWDTEFIRAALDVLDDYVLIQGSKNLPESVDRRPVLRKVLTWGYNFALRLFFGFKGTDTTGLKALRKTPLTPVFESCELEREMLETELVLRCQYRGLDVRELPVTLEEKRPQRDPLFRKIWINVIDLVKLFKILYWP